MKIEYGNTITETSDVIVTISGLKRKKENDVYVRTETGEFKISADGTVVFYRDEFVNSGEIVHKQGQRA